MSGNESGEKRATTEQQENSHSQTATEPDTKKLKLNDEAVLATLPILPNALVLDKAQQDTINQLVQGSRAVGPSTLNGMLHLDKSRPQ